MFHMFSHLLNNVKLRTKLILSCIVVLFIPILIVGVFLTNELRNMALDNAMEQTHTNVQRVKARTTELMNVAYDSAYRLENNGRLETVTNRRYESTYEVVAAYREYTDFNEIRQQHDEVANIRFYMENPTMLNNWDFIQPDKSIKEAAWYKNALTPGSGVNWYYLEDERDKRNYLSLVREIIFADNNTSGVLVITLNMSMMNSILNQESFETMIVDDNNQIVAANRTGRTGKTLQEIDFEQSIVQEKSGMYSADIDGQASRVLIEPLVPESSGNTLRIISVFSVDTIVKDANHIKSLAFTVISISLIIAIFLIIGVSTIITKRMLRLSKHITKVATGKLDIVMEIDGKDEIGQLSRQFNSMVSSINGLVEEVQETNKMKNLLESKQNEIKLKMMASQINPHFLFNALESIRMKAHLKGEKEISQVVRLLGKLMRRSIEVTQRMTYLADEMDIVRCYLDIQKFRYEDRLSYELHIDPIVEKVSIPPLIIQPLVENAVIHGFENKAEGGVVIVRATSEGDLVRIEVIDNGAGMTQEKIDSVADQLSETEDAENNRIGLRNVHLRLQLTYGQEHGLQFESEPGIGTKVSFTLPFGEDLYV
ncbi:sensor histidine kinase [Paenibacillus lupini]|uniref:sensor histidine kinase n=1 Tax=Paenibacillus lupini TaxID=1450204 RepID=UPI00141DB663|nr:sensor histidine kinase [Paenibacillus lupini]NIK24576.1 two-component system sensor histidine kinase YesM [Paenibacillus lupini]